MALSPNPQQTTMSAIDRAFIKAYGNDELIDALPPVPQGSNGRDRPSGKPIDKPVVKALAQTSAPAQSAMPKVESALPPPMTLGAPSGASSTRATNRRVARTSTAASPTPLTLTSSPSIHPEVAAPMVNPLGGIVNRPATVAGQRTEESRRMPKPLSATSVVPTPHASFSAPNSSMSQPTAPSKVQPEALQANIAKYAADSRWRVDAKHHEQQLITAPNLKTSLAAFEVDQFAWPSAHAAINNLAADEPDQLARQLSQQAKQGVKVIAVVAALSGDGCTTISQCLAQCAGRAGLRTVLVDGNFARPSLAESFGLGIDEGFEAVLAGQSQVCDVLVESIDDQFTVLPLKCAVNAELLQSSQPLQAAAMRTLRDDFDLVLIDIGAEMFTTLDFDGHAQRLLLPNIDAAIVVRDGRTSNRTVNALCHRLSEQQIKPLGVIENRCA